MFSKQQLGQEGESAAIQYLEGEGFRIVERNFRTRWGEIDLIAEKKREFYFIEVKTRQDHSHGHPLESLPSHRLQRLQKMSQFYSQKHRLWDQKLHLSLLGIDWAEGHPQFHLLIDIID